MNEQEFIGLAFKTLVPVLAVITAIAKPIRDLTKAINKLDGRLDLLASENRNQNEKLDMINKKLEKAEVKLENHTEKIACLDTKIENIERNI